jgi:hypothetical protein
MKKKEMHFRIEADPVEKLGNYVRCLPGFGDKIPIAIYRQYIGSRFLTDKDGYAYACKGDKITLEVFQEKDIDDLPTDATHVLWMNK